MAIHIFTVIYNDGKHDYPCLIYDDGIFRLKKGPESYYDYYWEVTDSGLIIADHKKEWHAAPTKFAKAFFEKHNKYLNHLVERDILNS